MWPNLRSMINAGIIGYRNHSKKIIDIVKKKLKIKYIFHPYKLLKIKYFTNDINNLLNTDCVFILCPSKFHFFYLNFLTKNNYKGYIFCEKPPVTNLNDLKKLKKILTNKFYFNYNLRFSEINKYLLNNGKFGKLIQVNIQDSKPYIFKKGISKNWRTSDRGTLLSNNLIHYIDLILNTSKNKISKTHVLSRKISNKFKLIDSFQVSFEYKKIFVNTFISYATVLSKRIDLYLTNARIEINDKAIKVFFPRDNLDKKKRFREPKLYFKKKLSSIFGSSNLKSVNYFINIVKKRKKFNKNNLMNSLESNKIILDIAKKLD